LKTSACNPQESILLFDILLTSHIFASGKVSIPHTMELTIDNCQLSKEQHLLERNYGPQSRAQHGTFRGRKHVYKNIIGSDSGLDEHYIQVRATCIKPKKVYGIFAWIEHNAIDPIIKKSVFINLFN
jgi:hypothetical protein